MRKSREARGGGDLTQLGKRSTASPLCFEPFSEGVRCKPGVFKAVYFVALCAVASRALHHLSIESEGISQEQNAVDA